MYAEPSVDDADMRRVLIISYYFPPMGFSGVQRIAKFVRYLPRFGWMPTVLTIHPAGYFAFDPTLLQELDNHAVDIVRTPSLDPTRLFRKKRAVAFPKEKRRRAASELSQWVFIPDNKIGWMPFARREGSRILERTPFDAIMSTAPPYTCHLIGSSLSRRHGIPLLLDYRDDWLDNPRHVYPTRLHLKTHSRMEKRAANQASSIVTINPVIAESISRRLGRHVDVISQGFDPADFDTGVELDPKYFRLTYTGVFYDAQRPDVFLEGCARFLAHRPDARRHLRLDFAGTLPQDAETRAGRLGLDSLLTFHGYLSHRDVVELQMKSSVLWMTIGRRQGSESISTGKLFEYVGAQRPILALVPDGTASDLLKSYNLATVVDPDEPELVAMAIERLYDTWLNRKFPEADAAFVRRFDRIELTRRLAALLTDISSDST